MDTRKPQMRDIIDLTLLFLLPFSDWLIQFLFQILWTEWVIGLLNAILDSFWTKLQFSFSNTGQFPNISLILVNIES